MDPYGAGVPTKIYLRMLIPVRESNHMSDTIHKRHILQFFFSFPSGAGAGGWPALAGQASGVGWLCFQQEMYQKVWKVTKKTNKFKAWSPKSQQKAWKVTKKTKKTKVSAKTKSQSLDAQTPPMGFDFFGFLSFFGHLPCFLLGFSSLGFEFIVFFGHLPCFLVCFLLEAKPTSPELSDRVLKDMFRIMDIIQCYSHLQALSTVCAPADSIQAPALCGLLSLRIPYQNPSVACFP